MRSIRFPRFSLADLKEDSSASKGRIFSGELTDASMEVLQRKKNRIAFRLLKYIYSFGEAGVPHGEIVRHLIEDLKGMEYTTASRNHWSTNLYGMHNKLGLYQLYCEKADSGRWRLNNKTREFFDKIFSQEEFSEVPANLRDRYIRGFR